MAKEFLHVLQPFLAFCIQFGVAMAHNMMTFMLDPKFQGLICVVDLIGKDRAWVLMEKYNKKNLVPLLVVVFKSFNYDYPQHFLQIHLFLITFCLVN
jgi:hypothetical protein